VIVMAGLQTLQLFGGFGTRAVLVILPLVFEFCGRMLFLPLLGSVELDDEQPARPMTQNARKAASKSVRMV
jgi:hypothetical protein